MASSNAARISAEEQPLDQQILYTAIRADGTPPRAVPAARPTKLASQTSRPATVEAVWVPWPSVSLGEGISPG